ncbi:PREDICTED: vegetative cell wall protein gp1-like [Ipomoea nil]|uniref:vegetative cell wall protein gp1-like n=1 Tax=Ipomoea nil TaxID=35883 RepID=UPI0009014F12|nr:PREDICTED: vegetative cell wall protein gp1-like [Ipomoea nil]
MLPHPEIIEQKLATQHAEMQKLAKENHRLAATPAPSFAAAPSPYSAAEPPTPVPAPLVATPSPSPSSAAEAESSPVSVAYPVSSAAAAAAPSPSIAMPPPSPSSTTATAILNFVWGLSKNVTLKHFPESPHSNLHANGHAPPLAAGNPPDPVRVFGEWRLSS